MTTKEYEQQIVLYLRSLSTVRRALACPQRPKLVRYMQQVAHKLHLLRTTLYRAVHLLDQQQLSEHSNEKLLLVAQACLLIAMKHEQIYPPPLKKWAFTDRASIIATEAEVLLSVAFVLDTPTAQYYLDLGSAKMKISNHTKALCEIVLDTIVFQKPLQLSAETVAYQIIASLQHSHAEKENHPINCGSCKDGHSNKGRQAIIGENNYGG